MLRRCAPVKRTALSSRPSLSCWRLQAEVLALALGLLCREGQVLRCWRDVEVDTCHPWPPDRFWRLTNAQYARLHVFMTSWALQVSPQFEHLDDLLHNGCIRS